MLVQWSTKAPFQGSLYNSTPFNKASTTNLDPKIQTPTRIAWIPLRQPAHPRQRPSKKLKEQGFPPIPPISPSHQPSHILPLKLSTPRTVPFPASRPLPSQTSPNQHIQVGVTHPKQSCSSGVSSHRSQHQALSLPFPPSPCTPLAQTLTSPSQFSFMLPDLSLLTKHFSTSELCR